MNHKLLLRRSFAILVNFNVDPDLLYRDARNVRLRLIKAVDYTKQLSQRADRDFVSSDDDLPLQLFRLKHEVLCKTKLDKAFRLYEDLEGRLILPRFSHEAISIAFKEKGRFDNAYVRQVMGMLNGCFKDFDQVTIRAWTLREKLHRDICMNKRFLERSGIEVTDVNWTEVLHWGCD